MTSSLSKTALSAVSLVATDLDDTLTKEGKFTAELLVALESLVAKEIPVLIVTGRSAGWVSAIANYLPITGAIAENGGLFYNNQDESSQLLIELRDLQAHRLQLKKVFQFLQKKFPEIKESADNSFRITDWTFDIGKLTVSQLETITFLCLDWGFGFTYSTVQCHIKPQQQDKAAGLKCVLTKHFSHFTSQQIVTVGDSPNDESLFNSEFFPLSVGVANVAHYQARLQHQPTYITSLPEVKGFCELAQLLT